jgi:hypothetical protein
LEYCIESVYNREIEKKLKSVVDIISQNYNGINQTELIRLDSNFTIKKLYDIIHTIKSSIDNIEIIKNLNSKNKDLTNIILSLAKGT